MYCDIYKNPVETVLSFVKMEEVGFITESFHTVYNTDNQRSLFGYITAYITSEKSACSATIMTLNVLFKTTRGMDVMPRMHVSDCPPTDLSAIRHQ